MQKQPNTRFSPKIHGPCHDSWDFHTSDCRQQLYCASMKHNSIVAAAFFAVLLFCSGPDVYSEAQTPQTPGAAASPHAQASGMPMPHGTITDEHLGAVSYLVSCAETTQAPFNRGVALLHDFWYEEAQHQFAQISAADPGCAMAQWGEAMAAFHQIWDRPGAEASAHARALLQTANTHPPKTAREREYLAALTAFFQPGQPDFQQRINKYSADMGTLYAHYPDDVDAGAFYALSLLAAEEPGDTTLSLNRKAMAVLTPLASKYPDHPGVVHYIIHACDNPTLAPDALHASDHYGEIAPAGAHAVHMPGHIYARLGMWPQDIQANLASVDAAETAEIHHESSVMHEPHAYDFLLYAYLQSAQDASAKDVLAKMTRLLDRLETMGGMEAHREGMTAYYRVEIPAFYYLEMRDWQAASILEPAAGSPPQVAVTAYWARGVAAGRMHHAADARADLARFDSLLQELKGGPHAYLVEGTGIRIARGEMLAWTAYAEDKQDEAIREMRDTADLQDKVGQGEVDIPAREMLADMLLDFHQPALALAEYRQSLKLSPNRFNGLYHAGVAAEAAGEKAAAQQYFTMLLKSTNNGAQSVRPEFVHVKEFLASAQVAAK